MPTDESVKRRKANGGTCGGQKVRNAGKPMAGRSAGKSGPWSTNWLLANCSLPPMRLRAGLAGDASNTQTAAMKTSFLIMVGLSEQFWTARFRTTACLKRMRKWTGNSKAPVAAILLRLLLTATVDADAAQLGVTVSQDLSVPGASQLGE